MTNSMPSFLRKERASIKSNKVTRIFCNKQEGVQALKKGEVDAWATASDRYKNFFTTKPVGKDTGLGLSICYQIIDKHQGKIEMISEFEQGTEFTIILPIKTQTN